MSVERELPTTSLAVLGLVAIRPASGYDLFTFADRTIAYFWAIPRSQVYRELSRLEGLGLISGTHVSQRSAPDKRVYEISEAGRAALVEWVETPTLPARRSKNGFLLKVFMARHARPESIQPLLASFRQSVQLERDDLHAIVNQLAGRPRARFGQLTARWGVLQAEASLAWLDEAETLLSAEAGTSEQGRAGPQRLAEPDVVSEC